MNVLFMGVAIGAPDVCWKLSVGNMSRLLSDSRSEHRCELKGCGHPHCPRMRLKVINS